MKLDEHFDDFYENVDTSIPFELRESCKKDIATFVPRLMAERAKNYWNSRAGITTELQKSWDQWKKLLSVLFIIILIVVSVPAAFATEALIISAEQKQVNILAVAGLLGVMVAFAMRSAFSLVSIVVRRLRGYPQTSVGNILLWIGRGLKPLYALIFQNRQSDYPIRVLDCFNRNSYLLAASWIFVRNLQNVILIVAILTVLWYSLVSTKVDYTIESSLISVRERTSVITIAATPVTLLTGTPAPGDGAIRWASGDAIAREVAKRDTNKGIEQLAEVPAGDPVDLFRSEWSHFLLSAVWTFVLIPRLVIAAFAAICILWFSRDLRPSLSDHRIRKIVDRILNPGPVVISDLPTSEPIPDDLSPRTKATLPASPTAAERITHLGCTAVAAVVGFGLSKEGTQSLERLVNSSNDWKSYGNLNGAREQHRFRSDWKGKPIACDRLIIAVSLSSVPTGSFAEFAEDIVANSRSSDPGIQTSIEIILTDGKVARERLSGDQDAFDARLSQWYSSIVRAGVQGDRIFEYDLNSDEGIRSALTALQASSQSLPSQPLKVAGKVREAVKIVRKHFNSVFVSQSAITSPIDWVDKYREICGELDVIYLEQRSELFSSIRSTLGERVRDAVADFELPAGVAPDALQVTARMWEYCKNISPKWICAGALAGLALGGAAVLSAVATGGVAVLPIALMGLPSTAIAGGAFTGWLSTRRSGADSLQEESGEGGRLSSEGAEILKACLLQIIVLELQGNQEIEITKQLREQSDDIELRTIRGIGDVDDMLRVFEARLLALKGSSNGF